MNSVPHNVGVCFIAQSASGRGLRSLSFQAFENYTPALTEEGTRCKHLEQVTQMCLFIPGKQS